MDEINQANKRIKTASDKYDADYRNFLDRLEQEEEKIQKRYELLEGRLSGFAEAHGNPNASGDDLIEINAGGKSIAAKRGTLCQIEGSRLEALFSGRWDKELQRDGNGRVFLDVNSEAFQTIVDYLNELAISSSDDPPQCPTSDSDSDNNEIDHLTELFTLIKAKRQYGDSVILQDANHITLLHDWLKEDGSDGEFQLLYRFSRDGKSGKDFHSKCDNKGCTLSVVETTDGLLIGGYSNTPWTSPTHRRALYAEASKAFLFALSGDHISSPCKMRLSGSTTQHATRRNPSLRSYATFHRRDKGPVFGYMAELNVSLPAEDSQLSTMAIRIGRTYETGPLRPVHTAQPLHIIKEMEVFQISQASTSVNRDEEHNEHNSSIETQEATSFSSEINEALNVKLQTLKQAKQEITSLERDLEDERKFIELIVSGDGKDVVTLNVSGTMMAAKRSTVMFFEESVLASQFDDSKWTEQGSKANRVKDWTHEEVGSWVESIDGIPAGTENFFTGDEINGRELLTLGKDDMYKMGIDRTATVSLLFDEIGKLKKASEDVATLIEHSPYCFGKILDYLRMKQLHSQNLVKAPDFPAIRESEKSRFQRVVKYFFPGSAELILGP